MQEGIAAVFEQHEAEALFRAEPLHAAAKDFLNLRACLVLAHRAFEPGCPGLSVVLVAPIEWTARTIKIRHCSRRFWIKRAALDGEETIQ